MPPLGGAVKYPGCSTDITRKELVHYCFQDKEGALLYLGEGKGALLFTGGGTWCYTCLRRKKLVNCCSHEKETCSQLLSG